MTGVQTCALPISLYRTGRRAQALAEYGTVKRHLREELGIDPGPGLQRLELLVLRGDPVPQTGPPARPGPPDQPASGPDVLQLLLRAGLLEQDPEGLYQMNGLLQAMTGASADSRRASGAQRTATSRSTGE